MLNQDKILELQQRGLINVKEQDDYLVIKYKNKVFYKGLWNEDPDLVETRGLILDRSFRPVSVPFHKVFNYKENGTTLAGDAKVTAIRKINGFFAAATLDKNGEPLITTTGSTDSPYTKLARQVLDQNVRIKDFLDRHEGHFYTYMFEICDPSDPHIIPEQKGAYLIGAREKTLRKKSYLTERTLDQVSADCALHRPEWIQCSFAELLDDIQFCRHEGYMVRGPSGVHRLKIKSPYYLVTKFMGRGKEKLRKILKDPKAAREAIDEEFYAIVDHIHNNYGIDEFIDEYTEQERVKIVREFFVREIL